MGSTNKGKKREKYKTRVAVSLCQVATAGMIWTDIKIIRAINSAFSQNTYHFKPCWYPPGSQRVGPFRSYFHFQLPTLELFNPKKVIQSQVNSWPASTFISRSFNVLSVFRRCSSVVWRGTHPDRCSCDRCLPAHSHRDGTTARDRTLTHSAGHSSQSHIPPIRPTLRWIQLT